MPLFLPSVIISCLFLGSRPTWRPWKQRSAQLTLLPGPRAVSAWSTAQPQSICPTGERRNELAGTLLYSVLRGGRLLADWEDVCPHSLWGSSEWVSELLECGERGKGKRRGVSSGDSFAVMSSPAYRPSQTSDVFCFALLCPSEQPGDRL